MTTGNGPSDPGSAGAPGDPTGSGGEDMSSWIRSGPNYQPGYGQGSYGQPGYPTIQPPQAAPAPYGAPSRLPAFDSRRSLRPLLLVALLGALVGAAIALLVVWLT